MESHRPTLREWPVHAPEGFKTVGRKKKSGYQKLDQMTGTFLQFPCSPTSLLHSVVTLDFSVSDGLIIGYCKPLFSLLSSCFSFHLRSPACSLHSSLVLHNLLYLPPLSSSSTVLHKPHRFPLPPSPVFISLHPPRHHNHSTITITAFYHRSPALPPSLPSALHPKYNTSLH